MSLKHGEEYSRELCFESCFEDADDPAPCKSEVGDSVMVKEELLATQE